MIRRAERSEISFNSCNSVRRMVFLIVVLTFPLLVASCGGLMTADPVAEAEKSITTADPFMGDWQGEWELDDGTQAGPVAAQVIALGNGKYRAVCFSEFDIRTDPLAVLNDEIEDDKAAFTGQADSEDGMLDIKGGIEDGKFSGSFQGQTATGTFELSRVIRLSPTLGEKPPAGAVVLFNGKNFKQWQHIPPRAKKGQKPKPAPETVQWNLDKKQELMEVEPRTGSIVTRKKFTDFKLHVEFRLPFMPDKRGQARANSGVYLQGRYEVQVLDSYGLEGLDNECGGIYKIGKPDVNMCAPPLQWQTYDITFHAPKAGKPAKMTAEHNGVPIHEDRVLPKPTGGALDQDVNEPGGIYLQDHGNRMQFRNIWLVEL